MNVTLRRAHLAADFPRFLAYKTAAREDSGIRMFRERAWIARLALNGVSVPDSDHERVDVGGLKLLTKSIEVIQLGNGPYANAMPDIGVYSNALNLGVDTLHRQLCPYALGIRFIAV